MSVRIIQSTFQLGRTPFKTFDPFLFCVYHLDEYPQGGPNMGPDPKLLKSRDLGMDFSYQDGWSMYHGVEVPGFPAHPHRGFETVTIARKGLVDHADSMGCSGRYGNGDTQWMTAGSGVQHSEMMPLVNADAPNTLDLFQVWLNLPKKDKMCPPAFAMFWKELTPRVTLADPESGKVATVLVVAGELLDAAPLAPPPNSWASDPSNDVAIWVLSIPDGCTVTLPAARNDASNRTLYLVQGSGATVGTPGGVQPSEHIGHRIGAKVDATKDLQIKADGSPVEILLLQGKPIGEPVVQHGPMVMNTREEIFQAFEDYQRTQYGGWPWKDHAHLFPRDAKRQAFHNGTTEYPPATK